MIDWDAPAGAWGNHVHEASDGSWTHTESMEDQ